MDIIPRSVWGARHRAGFADAPLPAAELYLHHSVTIAPDLLPPFDDDDAAVRTLERIGQQRFGGGISYTFAVTPAGRVYEGHGLGRRGAHTAGRNSIARAIVLVGDHSRTRPPEQMLDAVAELIAHGYVRLWWPRRLTGGHRDAPGASTACPGTAAWSLIPEINRRAGVLIARPAPAPTSGEDDNTMQVELHYYNDAWEPDPRGLNFRGVAPAECGPDSLVVARAWVRWFTCWGTSTWRVYPWDGQRALAPARTDGIDHFELPAAARGFTVEGRRDSPYALPSAMLLTKAK